MPVLESLMNNRAVAPGDRRPPTRNRNMLGGQGLTPEMTQPTVGANPQMGQQQDMFPQQQNQLLADRMANFRRGSTSSSYQPSQSEQMVNDAYDTVMPGIQAGLGSLMGAPQGSRRGSTTSSSSSWGVPYNPNDTGTGVYPNNGPQYSARDSISSGQSYSGYGSDSDYDSGDEGQPYGMPQQQQPMQPPINASPASLVQQGSVQSIMQPQFGTFPQAMAGKNAQQTAGSMAKLRGAGVNPGQNPYNPYPGSVPSYAQFGKTLSQPGFDWNNQADWDAEYTRQVNEYNQSRQSLDALRPKGAVRAQAFRFGGPQRPTNPYQVAQPAMASQMQNPLSRLMQTGSSMPAAQPQMMNAVKLTPAQQAAQDAQYKKAGVNNLNQLKNGGGQQQAAQQQQANQGGPAKNAGNQANQNQSDKIKMGKTEYNWLTGQEPYGMRLPILSDEQIQTMHRLLPGFEQKVGGNQYDFEPVAESMRDEFNRSVLPALANRFSAFGGGLSTDAYQNAAARALTDNEMNIAKMRGQYNLQKNAQDQSALSTLLGQQYETMYFPGKTGLYEDAQKAIPHALQKVGEFIAEKMLGGKSPDGGSWGDFFKGPVDKVKNFLGLQNKGEKLTAANGKQALDAAVNNPEVQAALQSSDPQVRKSAQEAVAAVTAAVGKNWGAWTGAGVFAAIAAALVGGAYLVDQYQNPADSPEQKHFDDHQKDMKQKNADAKDPVKQAAKMKKIIEDDKKKREEKKARKAAKGGK